MLGFRKNGECTITPSSSKDMAMKNTSTDIFIKRRTTFSSSEAKLLKANEKATYMTID